MSSFFIGKIQDVRFSNIDVNLRFDYTKQKKVLRLNVGDTITYTGRLVSLRGLFSPYRLDDVDFFRVR